MSAYEFWIRDYSGQPIHSFPLTDYRSATWARRVNVAGSFNVTFARAALPRWSDVLEDYWLDIWRVVPGSEPNKFITRGRIQDIDERTYIVPLAGPDMLDLLDIRINDATAGSAGADKSGTGDDVMKAYVTANLGSGAAAGRDLSGYGFAVQANLSAGPSVDKQASRSAGKLLNTLQELAATCIQKGTPVYFDVLPFEDGSFEFQTFSPFRGADRRYGSGPRNPLLEANTHLVDPSVRRGYRGEVNAVYGLGQGEGASRTLSNPSPVTDDARIKGIALRRREDAYNGSSYSTQAALTDATRSRLHEGRPTLRFNSQIRDQPGSRFGVDWDLGDVFTAQVFEYEFDVLVAAVQGSIEGNKESIVGSLEVYG